MFVCVCAVFPVYSCVSFFWGGEGCGGVEGLGYSPIRVQVPNTHILTQNLYYIYYYPKPKYLIIGYLDPLGRVPLVASG